MEQDRRLRLVLALAVTAIIVGGIADLVLDRPESWLSAHTIFEALLIAGALTMAIWLWLGWWGAQQDVRRLERALDERAAERDAWHASAQVAIEGFRAAIERQFRDWGLTPAETEVAFLLLQGHSTKAIAKRTGRSDATVRQHATAVYQKSSLAGRAQLAAWFLGDLLSDSASTRS